jgi:hypothetical protein
VNASSSPKGDVVPAADNTASDQRPTGRGGDGSRASRVEVIVTVLLALAAVATAWSGYQANQWHGEQAIAFSRANAARVESTRASDLADAQTEIDVATFTQWVDAYARHETSWRRSTASGSAPSSSRPWPLGSPPGRSRTRMRP